MRTVTQPSFFRSSRFGGMPNSRMRRPSSLPTITPTRSSWFQRLLWMFVRER